MNLYFIFIIIYLLSSFTFIKTINSSISSTFNASSREFKDSDLKILERNKRKYDLNERQKTDNNFRTTEIESVLNDDLNQNDDYCIIGDVCGVGGGIAGDANIPCHIKTKPKTLNDTDALDTLKTICPSLFSNQNNPAVCCSADQIREMEQNFANPRDLGMGKCPSCMQNFRTLHCEKWKKMTCSSRQSKFLQVVKHELVNDKENVLKNLRSRTDDDEDDLNEKSIKLESKIDKSINKTDYLVIELNYFLDKEFVSTLYESCKNVKSVIGGQLIDVLCGTPPCNPLKWLKFMGTSYLRRGFSPIQINYFPIEDQTYLNLDQLKTTNKLDYEFVFNLSNLTTIQPMNNRAYQCYERINSELGACVCADCERTCDVLVQNALPNPNYQQIRMLSAQNFTIFLGWLLFTMVALGVFLYFLLEAIKKRRTYSHDFTKESISEKSKDNLPYSASMTSVYKISEESADDDEKFVMTLGLKIECFVQQLFEKWGYLVATHPLKVLFLSLFLSLSLAMGCNKYKVTTDPVDLWVSTDSIARQDMEYFSENFWKFYRIEQLILAPKNISNFTGTYSDENDDKITKQFSTLFKREILKEAFELQISIEQLKIQNSKTGQIIGLKDICYQPIPNKCAIQSLFTYFENNLDNLDDDNYLERISICPDNPTYFRTDMNCMEKNGIPLIYPEVALGGFNERNFAQSKALIITFPVNNFRELNLNENAIEFENAFLNHIQNYIKKTNLTSHFDITYKAEKSIEDELDRQSQSDVGTVVVSYVIMFIYILIALGEKDRGYLLLNTKCTIGFAGVLVVILSVVSALGVFFFFDVPCTLIIVEVIPFLVLAVGIDNLFILVQTYYRDQRLPNEDLNAQFARICGEVFPSMLLSSTSMCACFLIGSYTPMPAVQKFALYAAVSLFINFLLQSSLFLSIFILDIRRSESNRFDIFCCFKAKKKESPIKHSSKNENKKINNNKQQTGLHAFFSDIYAPFMMKDHVRMFVIILFASWLCSSLLVISSIHIGLEQELTMPDDSYMSKYFKMYKEYFEVGPPVYFMIKNNGFNISSINKQNQICSIPGCETNSLLQVLSYWIDKQKMESYLSSTPSYFLDNYINYLQNPSCCLKFSNQSQCFDITNSECSSCIPNLGSKRPNSTEFKNYLNFFFNHVPNEECVLGGRAQFSSSVKYDNQNNIEASYIVTYNTPLKSSEDFYEALRQSRMISKRMTNMLRHNNNDTNIEVRPYSFPHVFYEQYLNMWNDTIFSISLSIGTILIVNFLFFGFDLYSALISAFTITMMIINLMGMMYWWEISLNAISLVNLVVGVGISVEFISHLLMQYKLSSYPTKISRAQDCLGRMGASVLSGITLTDCGILVLVFAKSKIFQVFYFRMYLGMIAFGTLHSLILFPVLLSFIGPPLDINRVKLNKIKEQERKQKMIDNQIYSV